MTDRPVRVLDSFYENVFRGLPIERGPNGEPSADDFLEFDLPGIIDYFAAYYDTLPDTSRTTRTTECSSVQA